MKDQVCLVRRKQSSRCMAVGVVHQCMPESISDPHSLVVGDAALVSEAEARLAGKRFNILNMYYEGLIDEASAMTLLNVKKSQFHMFLNKLAWSGMGR